MRGGLFLLLVAGVAAAHEPITTQLTWSAEISRIVYKRCSGCHRSEGSAMPLVTYQDARPWAVAIRDEVLNRRMPPWGAVKGFGSFRGDPSLTQDEILRIAEWVEGGAPEGDPKYLPPSLPSAPENASPPKGKRTRVLTLSRAASIVSVRPLADASDVKVTAYQPDGSTEPLVWLHGYKNSSNRTFVLAEPMRLPRGARVVATPPIALELILGPATPRPPAH